MSNTNPDLLSQHPIVLMTERFLASPGSTTQISRLGSDFLYMLACPDDFDEMSNWDSKELMPLELEAIRLCLPRILSKLLPVGNIFQSNDVTSVLAGMVYHQCWRACLETEAGSYALAGALLCFLDYYWADSSIDNLVEQDVRAILNSWLKPDVPFKALPIRGVVCQQMFGTAWVNIALPEECMQVRDQYMNQVIVSRLVLAERPPFIEGLCPAQMSTVSLALPTLGS